MGMIVNTGKTKAMIINSKNTTYFNFMYDNNNLEEVASYIYLIIVLHHKINLNYGFKKRIREGGKLIMDLKIVVNNWNFGFGIRRNSSLRLFPVFLFYMIVKFGAITFLENRG